MCYKKVFAVRWIFCIHIFDLFWFVRLIEILLDDINKYNSYWEQTRCLYAPFECATSMRSGNSDVYLNEIPGGQYTNLQFQAFSLGLSDQFAEVKQKYTEANELLGNIIKVRHPQN